MKIISIRGATTINNNTKEEILSSTKELLQEIISKNKIDIENITNVIFTATQDITKAYPAVAARELGINQAALLCMQEMYVEGSLEKCIRVMMQVQGHNKEASHIYLHGAKVLRPDIVSNESIAIDGPAGAGKSTIAKKVAKKLDYIYIDTGAMYRAVAYYCIINKIDIHNESNVVKELHNIDIKFINDNGNQNIYLNNKDISDLIRNPEISSAASIVAAYAKVREHLVDIQRKLSIETPVVMDGRDIGTHVLKNAKLKIFLTATSKERARRRARELEDKGYSVDVDTIQKDIEKRDYNDSNRAVSPLKQADDAILIDTTKKSIDEVVESILQLL